MGTTSLERKFRAPHNSVFRRSPLKCIELSDYRHLFKDEHAFETFVARFSAELTSDLIPVKAERTVLGAVLSPAGVKEVLYERIVGRLARHPDILTELEDRLKNDDIVE